jgi:hypothetical protein
MELPYEVTVTEIGREDLLFQPSRRAEQVTNDSLAQPLAKL